MIVWESGQPFLSGLGYSLRKSSFAHAFLTKSGDLGLVLAVSGVDFERLASAEVDNYTKRLESALKIFDEGRRVYQYLFKRNHETMP